MFSMEYKKIGARIAFYRKLRKMSQSQLERKSGISRTTISKIENGSRSYNIDCVFMLAKALDVEVNKIFNDIDEA